MAAAQALNNLARAAVGIGAGVSLFQASVYDVDGGFRAVMFDRLRGVQARGGGDQREPGESGVRGRDSGESAAHRSPVAACACCSPSDACPLALLLTATAPWRRRCPRGSRHRPPPPPPLHSLAYTHRSRHSRRRKLSTARGRTSGSRGCRRRTRLTSGCSRATLPRRRGPKTCRW